LKFFANHNTNSKIKVELSGTVLNYKGVPSIVGNVIRLDDSQKFNIVNAAECVDFKLSKRELEVLELICAGKSTQQIAELFFLSQRTIETYRAQLLSKTSSKNSAELIMFALKNKLVSINQ
jgi:DNA-binding NarL/FixJ family response regulator